MAYQKQIWRDYDDNKTEVVNMNQGAVVTPERLNHMETGIANSADKAEVTAQLQQKIPKNQGAVGSADLSQEVKEQMTGGSVAVVGQNTVLETNIVDRQVTPKKTSFATSETLSKNLFNVATITPGHIIVANGNLYTNTDYNVSDFIPVGPNETYSFNSASTRVAEFNASKTYITQTDKVSSITVGGDTSYIRVHYPKSVLNYQINKGNTLQIYDVFREGVTITNLNPASVIIEDGGITTEKIAPKAVTAEKLDIINTIPSFNLFDKTKVNKSGYYSSTTGVLVGSSTYWASELIPVEEGETYVHKTGGNVSYWDSNKVFVSGVSGADSNPFTVPAGVGIKYVSFGVFHEYVDSDMLVKGTVFPSKYTPYENKYELSEKIVVNNAMVGMVWNVLGDSITQALGADTPYHSIISQKIGLTVNNYGLSGSRIAIWEGHDGPMVERYSAMNDADIITVFGGTNDYGNSVTLGDINSVDPATFYGALNVLCLGLVQKYPGKRIGFITPMHRRNVDYAKMKSYVNAIKEVCEKFSIPVLDMMASGGLYPTDTQINNTYFHNADGLHPNNEGHKVIARRIEAFIKTL